MSQNFGVSEESLKNFADRTFHIGDMVLIPGSLMYKEIDEKAIVTGKTDHLVLFRTHRGRNVSFSHFDARQIKVLEAAENSEDDTVRSGIINNHHRRSLKQT